ncbi:putative ABC transporter ATP-binding protein [Oxobacter pfennigii]|uniref:Putative ABC transporter ATP-binding protein n=1 Tax=Oxobacter pfennigii TaxID=36849 RepID=A0A0P8Z1V0_9CLOT|nr:ABC transporter ATP-binding protein [Oxobacter pfennigii]KPU46090.1 putative ABC transporter ATP-binding protein [Oxobacter pfennigii]
MEFLNKYIKKYWKGFSLAILFLMTEAFCDLLQPSIMSKIVDIGVKNKQMDYVLKNGAIMLLVTFIGAIGAVGRNIMASNVSQKFGAQLRSDLFKKIQTYSFDNLDKFEGASLITRLTNDVTQIQTFTNGLMRFFAKSPILCIGSIIMAVRLNPRMSLVLLAVIPLISILIYLNLKLGYPRFVKVQKSLDKVNTIMREYLSGVRVVKAFNSFDYEDQRFQKTNEYMAAMSINAARIMAIFSPGISLAVNLGIVAVLWFGGLLTDIGSMGVGEIIAFINYMTQILFSLLRISFVFTTFVRARASAERISEVFSEENTMFMAKEPVKPLNIKGRIDFEGVYFSYDGYDNHPALKNINFTCMPGETLGIIGSTGSGKSSLVNLIPRFYDVSAGCVKIDGMDVKSMDMKELRNSIAIVPQKIILFTGTIMDNILWGKEDAKYEEVLKAAKEAQAHDFIASFPEGYNTMLGQGGVNLSGGQKQRVSIARALIKEPKILILDDCTSAVDMNTEAKIRQALRQHFNKLTCIIIAQRITSVMGADRVIVLDDGEIAGMGSHEELLNCCDVYKDIYHSQIGREVS